MERVPVSFTIMREYGLSEPTFDSLLSFLSDRDDRFEWQLLAVNRDASIVRARSDAATRLLRSNCRALLMIDNDLDFMPEDCIYIINEAIERDAVVSGWYSKRAVGRGWSGRFDDGVPHEMYSDEVVKLGPDGYGGGGFMAISRGVLERMVKAGVPYCAPQGFFPFFMECVHESEAMGVGEFLSEDWAFQALARETGSDCYVAMRPVLNHYGHIGYSALDGSHPSFREEVANA